MNFKNIATILIESYEIKFLSRCYLQCWITIHSSWISVYSFVRRVDHSSDSIFAVVHFLSLKKDNKEKHKLFCGTNVFSSYTSSLNIRSSSATTARMKRLHVETVFSFLGATRNDVDRKCRTNSTQGSYKLLQKLFLSPSLKCVI